MLGKLFQLNFLRDPGTLFCLGWAVVMLALTVALPQLGDTFIHSWRVELVASVFLLTTLLYTAYSNRGKLPRLSLSRDEIRYLIVPVAVFILWSALSLVWAYSWRSALHHTLVWTAYLIFFVTVRQLLEHGHNYGKLVKMLALTLSFFAVLAVLTYCTFLVFGGGTSIGIVYAKYGEQINTLFPLLFIGVLALSGRKFKLGAAVLVILWLLIFCSLSRTNLILFTLGTIVTAAFIFSSKRLREYRLKAALILVAIVAAPFPLHIFSYFSDTSGVPIVNRVSDNEGMGSSNNFRILMLRISAEMLAAQPLTGIGADNFGFHVNDYRAIYAAGNPNDPTLAESEAYAPERAHNEFAQITAELGIVGAAIFAWFLAGVGVIAFRAFRRRNELPPYAFAAALGLGLFLASSIVTSYSFRLIQNGFVFFFVLAVAAKFLLKDRQNAKSEETSISGPVLRLGYGFGVLSCVLLAAFCIVRVSSSAYTIKANSTPDFDRALPVYQTAMDLDTTNPEARYFLGLRLVETGRYSDAVPYLMESVRIGKARSADFSYLATAQTLAGDHEGAEKTFERAASLYPRSPFVLTRYAVLLQANGKTDKANEQLERARTIDLKAANSWWALINNGARAASDLAHKRRDHAEVMDLVPNNALYAVVAERDILYPAERIKFPWEKISNVSQR